MRRLPATSLSTWRHTAVRLSLQHRQASFASRTDWRKLRANADRPRYEFERRDRWASGVLTTVVAAAVGGAAGGVTVAPVVIEQIGGWIATYKLVILSPNYGRLKH